MDCFKLTAVMFSIQTETTRNQKSFLHAICGSSPVCIHATEQLHVDASLNHFYSDQLEPDTPVMMMPSSAVGKRTHVPHYDNFRVCTFSFSGSECSQNQKNDSVLAQSNFLFLQYRHCLSVLLVISRISILRDR